MLTSSDDPSIELKAKVSADSNVVSIGRHLHQLTPHVVKVRIQLFRKIRTLRYQDGLTKLRLDLSC